MTYLSTELDLIAADMPATLVTAARIAKRAGSAPSAPSSPSPARSASPDRPNRERETDMSTDTPTPHERRLYARGTPVRNLRLDETRWAAVQDEAARTGSTASDVMRDALDAYLDRRP